MKKISEKIGTTGTTIATVLTIITGAFACWQIYRSSTQKNLAGRWKLTFTNVESSYKAYIGETHTQSVSFSQNGCEITGDGEKCEYNWVTLPSTQRRTIEYKGSVEDDCLKAAYKLHGRDRISTGNIEVTISDDERTLVGKFSGTAADTRGTITGEKID
jgi:hypothetical protein